MPKKHYKISKIEREIIDEFLIMEFGALDYRILPFAKEIIRLRDRIECLENAIRDKSTSRDIKVDL